MENKILIELIVPELEEKFDIFIPITKRVGNIIALLAKALSTTPAYLMGWEEEQKKNDIQSDIILRMRTDTTFMSVVEKLYKLDSEKLESINQMLNTLFK
jgi:hypothetical protein